MPKDEQADLKSMIDEVFTVYEVDEYGHPWIQKWWQLENEKSYSHSLALLPEEMEKVS